MKKLERNIKTSYWAGESVNLADICSYAYNQPIRDTKILEHISQNIGISYNELEQMIQDNSIKLYSIKTVKKETKKLPIEQRIMIEKLTGKHTKSDGSFRLRRRSSTQSYKEGFPVLLEDLLVDLVVFNQRDINLLLSVAETLGVSLDELTYTAREGSIDTNRIIQKTI